MIRHKNDFLLNDINEFRTFCKNWKRDIKHVIEDLRYVSDGIKLFYAVDFSEVFSFSEPEHAANTFRLFQDEDEKDVELFQRIALERLFFNMASRPILLGPYAIELKSHFDNWSKRKTLQLLDNMPKLFKEQDRIQNHKHFKTIERISYELETNNIEPNAEDLGIWKEFLKDNSKSILAFSKVSDLKPLERILSLIKNKRLGTISDVTLDFEPVWLDELTKHLDNNSDILKADEKFILDKLLILRKHNADDAKIYQQDDFEDNHYLSSVLDTKAIIEIMGINSFINKRKKKVVLVTRSKHMHDTCECLWDERGYDPSLFPLRHPRIFSVHYSPEYVQSDNMTKFLKKREKYINNFLKTLDEAYKMQNFGLDGKEEIQIKDLLQELKQGWTSAKELAATLLTSKNINPNDEKWLDFENSLKILKSINSSTAIQNSIAEQIHLIHETITKEQSFIGTSILVNALDSNSNLKFPEVEMYGKKFQQKFVLRASIQAMPFTIQFSSAEVKKLIDFIDPRGLKEYDIKYLINFFRTTSSSQVEYEHYLAIAYILATLGKWTIAEVYCELALSYKPKYPHEGYFMLAICMRKNKMSYERIIKGSRYLKEASNYKSKYLQDSNNEICPDPRYQTEEITQIFTIYTYYESQINLKDNIPEEKDAIDMIEHLKDKITVLDDPILKIQICNNYLFYHIKKNKLNRREELISLKDLFNQMVKEQFNEDNPPPAFILDTLALAEWNFAEPKSIESGVVALNFLEKALRDKDLDIQERKRIKNNLDEINQGINHLKVSHIL